MIHECGCWPTLTEGIDAIDDLLAVYGVEVRKALNPLKLSDHEAIVKALAKELKGHVLPVERVALKKALATLDVDWNNLAAPARLKVIEAGQKYLGEPVAAAVMPKIEQTLAFNAKDIVAGTKKNSVLTYDLKVSPNLEATDERIVDFMKKSQGHFVRDEFGQRRDEFGAKAKAIVASGLERGLGSEDIATRLHNQLSLDAGKGEDYWNIIAMVFANRARTMTQLASFHESGIEEYLWESVLDRATSVQCRFMHGRKFPVRDAMKKFQEVEDADSPEDVKTIQPFLQFGNVYGKEALYYGPRANAQTRVVAHVTENAAGKENETGKFANALDNEQLMKLGIHAPPLHGRCRSTIIPEFGGGTPAAPGFVPPEPTPQAPKPTPGALKSKALETLDAISEGGEALSSKVFSKYDDDAAFLQHPAIADAFADDNLAALWQANAEVKKPKLEELIATTPSIEQDVTAKYIQSAKKLDAAPSPKVAKYKGKLWIVDGHEQLAAQKLMGQKVAYCEVVNLDKALKPIPVTAPAPVAPAPAPVPVAPPPAPAPKANVILGRKIADAKGSNEGGVYEGTDGVRRYVKFYKDESQASGEHLANGIYRDLGLGAPDSVVFEHEGKLCYASKMVDGLKTLQDVGVDAAKAKKAMSGFVADVLTGNWDAVGMSNDNMVVDAHGHLFRIDNGGTFLMRAKAGRKGGSFLNAITEWDYFFSSGNPSYSRLAAAAGISSPEDFKNEVVDQIKAVLALRDAHGGWGSYVDKMAPMLKPADRNAIVGMLDERSRLLHGKMIELSAVKQPFEKPKTVNIVGWNDAKHGSALESKMKSLDSSRWRAAASKAYKSAGVSSSDAGATESLVGSWVGEYSEGSEHKRVYAASRAAIGGAKPSGSYAETVTRVAATRQERWRAVLDEMGLKDVPTPTHFDVERGFKGEDAVLDVARAWKDDNVTHVKATSHECASWSFSRETSQRFAGSTGVIYRWHCPIENTVADQVADDGSFVDSFRHEHEVIAGTGDTAGVRLPKEAQVVRYGGRNYTYAERKDLLERLKRDGRRL